MAVLEPPFSLEARTGRYDFRRYGPMVVAETLVKAGFDDSSTHGFKVLADYISGQSAAKPVCEEAAHPPLDAPAGRITMTAPVSLVPSRRGFMMQFTMPSGLALASLPIPGDPRIQLREIPARMVAVLRYSGSWSEARFHHMRRELLSALRRDGVQTRGPSVFARFNSPFWPWFLRRNEVWVEVIP